MVAIEIRIEEKSPVEFRCHLDTLAREDASESEIAIMRGLEECMAALLAPLAEGNIEYLKGDGFAKLAKAAAPDMQKIWGKVKNGVSKHTP